MTPDTRQLNIADLTCLLAELVGLSPLGQRVAIALVAADRPPAPHTDESARLALRLGCCRRSVRRALAQIRRRPHLAIACGLASPLSIGWHHDPDDDPDEELASLFAQAQRGLEAHGAAHLCYSK